MPLVTKSRKVDPLLRGVASKFTKYEQAIYDIYVRAFSQMPKDLNNATVLENIRAAIASNNPSGGAAGLSWGNFVGALDKTVPTLANQLAASANLSAASLPKSIQIASSFTATDPRAIAWAQQRAGARILGITKESQKAVTETIARGLKGQLTRDEVVDEVTRAVGLDSRQARALGTFYEKNLNALLDQGLSYENAARAAKKLGEKYRDRLIRQRATRIAHTETNAAANAGRLLSWAEADLQGFLPMGSEKRWKTSEDERNCPTCRPMHNETVPWEGAFSTGDIMPPVHVNCLCTAVIVPAEAEFEKSLYSPMKETRKTAWLFAKHGSHNQKTHGGKGGGGPITGAELLDRMTYQRRQGFSSKTVPSDQDMALFSYTSNSYLNMQSVARTGEPALDGKDAEQVARITQANSDLAALIESAPPLTSELTTYRGIQGDIAKSYLGAEVGDVITDRGFSSTSLLREKAEIYISEPLPGSLQVSESTAVLEIISPTGTRGVMVEGFYNDIIESDPIITDYLGTASSTRTQYEWLLNRGSSFEVVSTKGNVVTVKVSNG